jgi:S-adenosylmethionine-diacylglycerol 3-amino-3-carboxypropyl transferase
MNKTKTDDLTQRAAFDFIRYANCWEDPEILIKGLDAKPGGQILSVGSAGDNSFSLLTTNPSVVVAVDVSMTQLHLIALKKACIKQLNDDELIAFLGFMPSETREQVFNKLKTNLDPTVRAYWEHHIEAIRLGVVHQGKFEKYFKLFSQKILPWIHTKTTTQALLSPKSAADQQAFYDQRWNTWRWRLLFKVFFSKYVMGKFGRDPEFLKEVKLSVGDFIFQKAERHLQSRQAQENHFLRYNLTGTFGTALPHYLEADNLPLVRQRLDKLHLFAGYAQEAIQQYGTFNSMNLSNIFEYMNPELFQSTAEPLIASMPIGGRIGYWNLMVPRRISGILPEKAKYLRDLSTQLTQQDKGFFYNQFVVDEII